MKLVLLFLRKRKNKTFRQFSYSPESMQIAHQNGFLSYRNRGHWESFGLEFLRNTPRSHCNARKCMSSHDSGIVRVADILDASWSMKIMNGLGSRPIISCFGLIKQLNELRPRQVTEWDVSSHPWASKCHAERTASASQLSIPHTIFLRLHNRFTILIRSSTFDC